MICQVELKNFKCFETLDLELGSLSILSGLNGMGKSTVLQSLLLLRQSYQQNLLPYKGIGLNGELVNLGKASDILCEYAKEDVIGINILSKNNNKGEWLTEYDPTKDVLTLKSKPKNENIYTENLFMDDFQYLEAERLGPRISNKKSEYMVIEHRQIGKQGEYTFHFLDVYGNDDIPNETLVHPQGSSNGLRHQVETWLGEVSPGIRLDIIPIGMDLVKARYSFVTGKQVSNPYPATNVGFGLTYTLPVIVSILYSKPGAIIILENPEAHLHPQGQVRIGEMIAMAAASGVQIIVETHSDHVLNGVRVAVHEGRIKPQDVKIHFFQRQGEDDQYRTSVITPSIDRDGRIDKWPEGFFDQWDKSLDILLTPSER